PTYYPLLRTRPGYHITLHSFPTRRSSDLPRRDSPASAVAEGVARGGDRWLTRSGSFACSTGFGEMSPGFGRGPSSNAIRWDWMQDRKSTRLNSSHVKISYAVFCLKKKKKR